MTDDLFAPYAANRGKWPSEQLSDYLTGGGDASGPDSSDAIKSWAAYYIHDAAKQICAMGDKEKRRTALGKIPDAIRPSVEAEVKRMWPLVRRV